MKDVTFRILLVLVMFSIFVLSAFFIEWIVDSDLPTWLKVFLLR